MSFNLDDGLLSLREAARLLRWSEKLMRQHDQLLRPVIKMSGRHRRRFYDPDHLLHVRSSHTLGVRHDAPPESKPYAASDRRAWCKHLTGCKRRHIANELTITEYLALAKAACSYCGSPPTPRKLTAYAVDNFNGVDRVDATTGYVASNCVTCCWNCNRAKGSLTSSEFIEHARRIVSFQESLS